MAVVGNIKLKAFILAVISVLVLAEDDNYGNQDKVAETLERASDQINNVLDELQRVSDSLEGEGDDDRDETLLQRRDTDEDEIAAREEKGRFFDEELINSLLDNDDTGVINGKLTFDEKLVENQFICVLNKKATDQEYEAVIEEVMNLGKEAIDAGADIPPFRRPTLTDAKEEYDEIGIDSGPIGFFDLRDYREDYELPALDKDSEALRIVQQWPYEHRREGRVDFGLRGFIFLGTLKMAAELGKHKFVAFVERNGLPKPSQCQLTATVAPDCNWGKPRLNYDAANGGGGGAAHSPNLVDWWTGQACGVSQYHYDPAKLGQHVKGFIVDTGVNWGHADFNHRVLPSPDRALTPNEDPTDDHGTFVAGVITSTNNGVAPGTRIMSYKGNNPSLAGSLAMINAHEHIIRRYVMDRQTDRRTRYVVNQSMNFNRIRPNPHGGAGDPADCEEYHVIAVEESMRTLNRRGLYLVNCAGNCNSVRHQDACGGICRTGRGVAAWDQVIVAGAHDTNDVRSEFSNMGTCVTLHGPGEGIRSIALAANAVKRGTSFAAPHVAGVVIRALEDADLPFSSNRDMREFLLNRAGHSITAFQPPAAGPARNWHNAHDAITGNNRLQYYCAENERVLAGPVTLNNFRNPPGPRPAAPAAAAAPAVVAPAAAAPAVVAPAAAAPAVVAPAAEVPAAKEPEVKAEVPKPKGPDGGD